MATREEDFVEHLFVASTHDTILFFTEGGRAYYEKVYELPEAARTARGKAIVNLLNLRDNEQIAAMIRVRDFTEDQHLVMATRRGIVKKTNLAAFRNISKAGIIAINIDEKDRLIAVRQTGGSDELILTTRNGMSIRFSEEQLRDQGRPTRGVKGITLGKNDEVDSLEIVDPAATFMVCTENGYGKRTQFGEYRSQRRAGRGLISIRTSKRNGTVVGAHSVLDTDSLMLITANGKMIKMSVGDVRVIGRATQGVRLIQLDKGDKLVCATTVEPEDEDLIDESPGAADGGPPLPPPKITLK
jgi:DNA gyrase subunit A